MLFVDLKVGHTYHTQWIHELDLCHVVDVPPEDGQLEGSLSCFKVVDARGAGLGIVVELFHAVVSISLRCCDACILALHIDEIPHLVCI